jgi:hypothetical protein
MEHNTLTMTNKEKIEQFLTNDTIVKDFYMVSEINENLFIYYIDFVDMGEWDGIYDCSVEVGDQISYLRHIRDAE